MKIAGELTGCQGPGGVPNSAILEATGEGEGTCALRGLQGKASLKWDNGNRTKFDFSTQDVASALVFTSTTTESSEPTMAAGDRGSGALRFDGDTSKCNTPDGVTRAKFDGQLTTGSPAGAPGDAQRADFTPAAEYHLCSEDSADECVYEDHTDSAAQFRIRLEQDDGEEEVEHITLEFAPGFRFPTDAQIPNGERLGTAHIVTGAGPGCAGAVGTLPVEVDGQFEERDRTDEEIEQGVRVVLRLNLDPIPPLDIKVYGNAREGHQVEADLEDRSTTCPPFTFNGTFFARSEDSGIPILRTPRTPGRYALRATLTGTQGSLVSYRYLYKFPPGTPQCSGSCTTAAGGETSPRSADNGPTSGSTGDDGRAPTPVTGGGVTGLAMIALATGLGVRRLR